MFAIIVGTMAIMKAKWGWCTGGNTSNDDGESSVGGGGANHSGHFLCHKSRSQDGCNQAHDSRDVDGNHDGGGVLLDM